MGFFTSIASERIKNPINSRNSALTNPAMTSALTYLEKINCSERRLELGKLVFYSSLARFFKTSEMETLIGLDRISEKYFLN